MVLSTMHSIVCRRLLAVCFISLFLLCPSYVNGEENTCELQSTGNCTNTIIVTIDEKSAVEETSFNLYYYPAGKKELVAVLFYTNSYICHPTNGYKCTKTTDVTFNINLGCAPLQNVTLVGDGKQPVTCLPMENSPLESTNNSNHDCSVCAKDKASGNYVDRRRQKRCACSNESPKLSADITDIRKPDDTEKRGNSKVNVLPGVIIGIIVSLIVVAVVGVVLYHRRNSIMSFIRKGYILKHPHLHPHPVNEDL